MNVCSLNVFVLFLHSEDGMNCHVSQRRQEADVPGGCVADGLLCC